jgi:mannose/cellobiose epimerase-like protein (N-acyl-D-glucosamine 2-epimerase family)
MHLLEASLLHYAVTESEASHQRIAEIAAICVDRFILEETGFIAEQCAPDFTSPCTTWVEPGHCYEWAYLLQKAAEALDDSALSRTARSLFDRSESFVEHDGLVMDRTDTESPTYRLWPQLERLRCIATFGDEDAIPALLETLQTVYIDGGPDAGWIDKVDADRAPLSDRVPASMLYHFLTAIPTVTRPDIRL